MGEMSVEVVIENNRLGWAKPDLSCIHILCELIGGGNGYNVFG